MVRIVGLTKNKLMNKNQKRPSYHYPTLRMKIQMRKEGLKWMPKDLRDNKASNFYFKDEVEKEYKEFLNRKEKSLKWIIEQYTNEDGTINQDLYDDEYYQFLKMTPQERLSIPDSKFVGDGTWNSQFSRGFMGSVVTSHKGNHWTRIRVPSLKREKATWQKFYNEFPSIAAEVRWGYRRFVNGAKCEYIW